MPTRGSGRALPPLLVLILMLAVQLGRLLLILVDGIGHMGEVPFSSFTVNNNSHLHDCRQCVSLLRDIPPLPLQLQLDRDAHGVEGLPDVGRFDPKVEAVGGEEDVHVGLVAPVDDLRDLHMEDRQRGSMGQRRGWGIGV